MRLKERIFKIIDYKKTTFLLNDSKIVSKPGDNF